jgi:hypothetical protein
VTEPFDGIVIGGRPAGENVVWYAHDPCATATSTRCTQAWTGASLRAGPVGSALGTAASIPSA